MAGRGYSGRNVLLDLKVEYEYQNVVRDEYGGYISGGLLKEFDPHLWLITVEYVTIMNDGTMTFRFFDGTEVMN